MKATCSYILAATLAAILASAVDGDEKHKRAPDYAHIPSDWLGTGSCSPPCDGPGLGEFCGTDDRCRPYSCQNWYHYGPPVYVGHERRSYDDKDGAVPLECDVGEGAVPEEVREWGVVYGCMGYSNMEPEHGEGLVQRFTESCVARNRGTTFLCYGMAQSTDFSTFRRNVDRGGVVCSNRTELPRHIYQIHLQAMDFGVFYGPNSTETFNKMKARRTMWAQLSNADAVDSGVERLGLGKTIMLGSAVELLFVLASYTSS